MRGSDVEGRWDTLNALGFAVDVTGLHGPGSTAATKRIRPDSRSS